MKFHKNKLPGVTLFIAFLLFSISETRPAAACRWIKPYAHPVHGMIISANVYIAEIYEDHHGNYRQRILKNYKGENGGRNSKYVLDIMCGIGANREGIFLFLNGLAEQEFANFEQAIQMSDHWWNVFSRRRTQLQFQISTGPAPLTVEIVGPKKFLDDFSSHCENGKLNKGGIDWGKPTQSLLQELRKLKNARTYSDSPMETQEIVQFFQHSTQGFSVDIRHMISTKISNFMWDRSMF